VKPALIAGIGGVLLGHALWLIGISMATGSASRDTAVLVVSVLFLFFAAAMAYLAWQRYQRGESTWCAFLGGLAPSPVVFTVIVLGVTYL
jgi:thiol:disulfide interchange protein